MTTSKERYYQVLELEPGASPEQVRCAFRELARIWHPDRYATEAESVRRRAEEKMRGLTEAYEALRNEAPSEQAQALAVVAFVDGNASTGQCAVPLRVPLRPVRFGGLYGYVEPDGRLAIAPQYTFADTFAENLARVQLNQRTGFINGAGEFVVAPVFEGGGRFCQGLAAVRSGGKWGYVSAAGEVAVGFQFESAAVFSNGLAVVSRGGRYGYLNASGELVIPCIYDAAEPFGRERGRARLADQWGKVDRAGQFFLDR